MLRNLKKAANLPYPPRLWLLALALWIAVTVVSVIALWHLRREALGAQWRETQLLSLALTDEIDRGLHGVEDGLSAMGAELRSGQLQAGGLEEKRVLGIRAQLMPLVRTLWILDRNGRLLSASDETPAPELSSFFPSENERVEEKVAVSRPFTDEKTRESLVALAIKVPSKRVEDATWIVAALPATSLLGAFSAASHGTDARMAVFRLDGVRLVGTIINRSTLDETAMAQLLAIRPSMELHRFRDGSERLVSQNALPRFGLKMILTRDLDTALQPWRETAQVALVGLLLLLTILITAVRRVVRADRRQADAQQALQLQRSRASKLESLGTLAGSVAHDFNNVLAAIVGFGEMAQDAALPNSNQARHLDKVLQAALRGKALVDRILAFSRGGAHTVSVFALEPIVEEVLALPTVSMLPGISVERRFEAPAAHLRGDATQIYEAILNLCTNAIQAMTDSGGTLCIGLERLDIKEARVLSHSQLAPGQYLSLSVADQGVGIGPDVMEHLFEPFFTTRRLASGTGLGLAVVHGVVAELGGAIDVQSTPGVGSRFTLYFRECPDAVSSRVASSKSLRTGAGQRLLLVDDEPALVALMEEMLKELGYEPLGYSDPKAALAAFRNDPAQFAAVITDEAMPGLCGTQLTEALRPMAPEVPVLLVSGYGGALLAARATAVGVTRILSKPLRRAELAKALNELLPMAGEGKR